jgi:hypothetical protein
MWRKRLAFGKYKETNLTPPEGVLHFPEFFFTVHGRMKDTPPSGRKIYYQRNLSIWST